MRDLGFSVFVYDSAPCQIVDVAIAASRSGSLGVVNAELWLEDDTIVSLVAAMADRNRGARNPFGLKLARLDPGLIDRLLPYASAGLTWLIVDAVGLDAYFSDSSGYSDNRNEFLLVAEVDSRIEFQWLDRVQAIVVKGNESGGFVGEESSFILFQFWRNRTKLPIFVRGGLSPEVAAACHALGAAGGVYDSQVLLLPESRLPQEIAALIEPMSGTETVAVGDPASGRYFRVLQHPKCTAAAAFAAQAGDAEPGDLRRLVGEARFAWTSPDRDVLPLGQDAAFAAPFRNRYGSLRGLLKATRAAVADYPGVVAANPPLVPGSAFARAIGTELPIIQGPMTRVSDNADFAAAIARSGALPMTALAVMRPEAVSRLLAETRAKLEGRRWGVGLLGFLPKSTLDAQIEAVLEHRPDFAIIAGGRPDQVLALEARGIPGFLHLPSAKLLPYFLENGARRLVFEGRECGGHIGPLSSFTLWTLMVDQILQAIDAGMVTGPELDCVFAGGIHDAASSALVQVLVAPLVAKGVRIGVIMGTAYVFTREIVESGAVVSRFQSAIVETSDTVNLSTGPGHASRCIRTPFVDTFLDARRKLQRTGTVAGDDMREALDGLILGTLRIASKGLRRSSETGEIETIAETEQFETGMYMIGQVASLRNAPMTLAELHGSVIEGARALIEEAAEKAPTVAGARIDAVPADIAIIGLSGALPGAMDLDRFWSNLLGKVDSITEIPAHRWDWRLYFDADRKAKDKIYSKWGGFLEDMPFDPKRYGITPLSLKSVDPMQLMGLKLADDAMVDAGYERMDPALKERTAVVIGASGGSGDVGLQYGLRAETPRFAGDLPAELAERLPEWSEDTFAGILINVLSGRISNRLDLGGPNFTTDAACASSLAAIYQAVGELRAGRCDMAVAGGVDTQQSPFGYLCFAQTQALSPTGRCRSFDQSADGIAISEGIVMVVLKRLEDAEAAGDRIYSVIKGIGSGSDGKAKALNAPEPAGQLRAMRRAYDQAGYGPETVRLFEAHGTGTVAGDSAELESTRRLLGGAEAKPRQAVIGSVKTNIGHTKASAGVAGLLKVALALHHKVLPPHRGVEVPNPILSDAAAPFHLLAAAEPWLADQIHPRRASVSAFGFGGTNFHATLEEYAGEYRAALRNPPSRSWPCELLLLSAADRGALAAAATGLVAILDTNPDLLPRDVARAYAASFATDAGIRASIVFADAADLRNKLTALDRSLGAGTTDKLPRAIRLAEGPVSGALAAMFPGQGSQYIFMGRAPAVYFREVAEALQAADTLTGRALAARYGDDTTLSRFLFPRGAYDEAAQARAQKALTATDIAQPALGAVEAGLWRLLNDGLGVTGDLFAGHSYGEFAALHAAGVLSFADLMAVSEARGRLIVEKSAEVGAELGGMLAINAPRTAVEQLIAPISGLVIANHNAPTQVIVSGPTAAVTAAAATCAASGIDAVALPVAAAFHSTLMEPAREALGAVIDGLDWNGAAAGAVYSNSSAAPHEGDLKAAMTAHLVSPVNFVDEVEAMYAAGARLFVEVGPKSVLTGLVSKILGGRPFRAVSLDDGAGGLAGVLGGIGELAICGRVPRIERLFEGRDCAAVMVSGLADFRRSAPLPKHGWWINGSGVRRANESQRQVGVTVETLPSHAGQPAPAQSSPVPKLPTSPAPHPSGAQIAAAPVAGRAATAQRGAPGILVPSVQSKGNPVMYNRPLIPDREPPGSISAAFFEMVSRAIESAQAVAMSELGAEASTQARPMMASARMTHKRVAVRPVPQPAALAGDGSPEGLAAAPEPWAAPAPMPGEPAFPVTQTAPVSAAAPLAPAPVAPAAGPVAAGAAEAVAPPAPALAGPLDGAALRRALVKVVCEKTGYDEDMLAFDQNLEAELGIDSIKRVDVVAGLMKDLPEVYRAKLGDAGRGALSTSKTLQEMLDILGSIAETAANFDLAGAGSPEIRTAADPDLPRPIHARFLVDAVEEPIGDDVVRGLTPGAFLIVPDRGGALAAEISLRLVAEGAAVETLPEEALSDEPALGAWIAANRDRLGALAGIVHLAAVGEAPLTLDGDAGADAWRAALFRAEKSLFLLAGGLRLLDEAHVAAATGLGGRFARDRFAATGLGLQGGAVGLLKSLAREQADKRLRAVDLDPGQPAAAQAGQIIGELLARGGRVEVGYPEGRRTVFRTVFGASPSASAATPHGADTVVLVTGGARGITAETVAELARPGTVLVLAGRAPLPNAAEAMRDDAALAALVSPQDLTRHFARSEGLNLNEARRRAGKVLAAREMLDNLAALAASGARVEYLSMDVVLEAEVEASIAGILARHGRIDGVVHGAGVIEDRLLGDIASDSWDRVVETKVIGLLLLLKHLPRDRLDFFWVYSSVAGRYGNAGQTSYATANELMNRLCCQLQAQRGEATQVRALNWGPWGPTRFGLGMVTPETERKFRAQGVELVDAALGRGLFRAEFAGRRVPAEVEVICGAAPWEQAEARRSAFVHDGPAGLIGAADIRVRGADSLELSLGVSTAEPYLRDHVIDGKPVLPMAIAIEMMAQAVRRGFGGSWRIVAVSDVRLFKGVVLETPRRDLVVRMTQTSHGMGETQTVSARIVSLENPGQPHFAATLELAAMTAAAAPWPDLAVPGGAVSQDAATTYRDHLFHGPAFQAIRHVDALWETGIRCRILTSRPGDLLRNPGDADWLFDPLVVDAVAQLPLVWSSTLFGRFALPVSFGRLARFADSFPATAAIDFRITEHTPEMVVSEAAVTDAEGAVLLTVSDMRHAFRPGSGIRPDQGKAAALEKARAA